uniref:NADH dehydrogenase subunit 3 n=1 Tax=Ennucula tenuis TaxID=106224 RepID=UPI00286A5E6B|nr:NADH dehydrogenase subunit 3 [Ennucula tenuis]WLV28171.1 NADH dehydrogenase subunit 3 [Ennucula tenuis]
MMVLFLGTITSLVITSVLLLLGWIVSKRTKVDREKQSAFECGFDPMGLARIPFSTRFFLLAVIFLIFDVEIVLLFPIISTMLADLNMLIMSGASIFLLVLMLGLFHEWNEGSLEWME